jgi:hypothetical protein
MMNHCFLPSAVYLLIVQIAPAQINNVRVTNNVHDQSEMAIAISPLDPNLMLASWNDFRPTPNNQSGPKAGYAFSTDGGTTWLADNIIEEHNDYVGGVDPSVAFDRNGMAFYCYVAMPSGGLGRIYVSRTSSIDPPDWEHYPVSTQTSGQDKPYIAIDNTEGQFDGRIYASWTGFGTNNYVAIRFAYSTNGGEEFIGHRELAEANPPLVEFKSFELDGTYGLQEITELVHWSMPAVGPDGELYVCWFDLGWRLW